MIGSAGAKARRLLGIAPPRYGDIVRFKIDHHGPYPLSNPLYDARFMWITTQYEDAYGGDIAICVCIRGGGAFYEGYMAHRSPELFEVVA